jgi:lysophospholipase L1-like esterase
MADVRRWLFKLVLLALSTGVAVLGLELGLRVTGLDQPLVWQPDPRVGWWHIPGSRMHWTSEGDGHVLINSLGMRDVERTTEKKPGVFRIAVFGDSMTEGVQVDLEHTYTQQLEKLLRARGLSVEVLNFGLNGYSPLSGYLLYDSLGKTFHPDLVIHAVFTDNDIADGDPKLAAGQVGAPFVIPGSGPKLDVDYSGPEASYRDYREEPVYTIRRWSATYRTLGAFKSGWAANRRAAEALRQSSGVPKRFLLYADPLSEPWEQAWQTYARILGAFAANAQVSGSHFVLLSVPAGQVASPAAWAHVLTENPSMQPQKWDLDGPERRMQALAAAHQIPLIQPIGDFKREVDRGDPLFFDGIGHMTPRGHTVMANAIADYLTSHGFLSAARGSR